MVPAFQITKDKRHVSFFLYHITLNNIAYFIMLLRQYHRLLILFNTKLTEEVIKKRCKVLIHQLT